MTAVPMVRRAAIRSFRTSIVDLLFELVFVIFPAESAGRSSPPKPQPASKLSRPVSSCPGENILCLLTAKLSQSPAVVFQSGDKGSQSIGSAPLDCGRGWKEACPKIGLGLDEIGIDGIGLDSGDGSVDNGVVEGREGRCKETGRTSLMATGSLILRFKNE